ncbi:MAG: hypothetical protein RLP44_01115 [Aggregatilineales bacterium]
MSGYELIPVMQAMRNGDNAEARRLLQPILDANPSADAYLLMAKVQDDDSAIVANLQRALEMNPDLEEARQLLEEHGVQVGAGIGEIDPFAEDVSAGSSRNVSTGEIDPQRPEDAPRHLQGRETVDDPDAEGVYEMLWDCKFCGTTKLLGKTHKFCPVCGAAQDTAMRYFPSDEDKVAVKDHHFVGADVTCGSCGTLNTGDAGYCTNCGAPLENAEAARTFGMRLKAEGQRFMAENVTARVNAEQEAYARGVIPGSAPTKAQSAEKKSGSNWKVFAIIGVVIAVIGGIAFTLLSTKSVNASVVDRTWERSIAIEILREENGSAECGSQPGDAIVYDRRREQVDTRRVQTGETCRNVQVDRGDGTFRQERQCDPVYENEAVMGDVCYYTVERWRDSRTVTSEGAFGETVTSPNTGISRSCSSVGCERAGSPNTKFLLHFEDAEGDVFDCDVPESEWRETPMGAQFTFEQRRVGGAQLCNTLERAG